MKMMGYFLFFILILIVISAFQVSAGAGFVTLIISVIVGLLIGKHTLRLEAEEDQEKNREIIKLQKILEGKKHYTITQQVVSDDIKTILSYDEGRGKINFTTENGNKTYEFKDIMQSEIIQNGVSVTKTSRGSQLGGAIVGGVLLGGVGAVIGSLSGITKTEEKIKKIQLKIVVKDTHAPNHYVSFLDSEKELENDNSRLQSAVEKVNHWNSIISVLINKSDEKVKDDSSTRSVSAADELLKLSELLKQGLITQDEFDKQKLKLLS